MDKIIDGQKIKMTAEEISVHNSWSETDAKKLQKIKDLRLDKLMETDWWVMRGNMTEEQSTYRQKLRDIPQDYTASDYDALLEMEGEVPNKKLKHTVWEKP